MVQFNCVAVLSTSKGRDFDYCLSFHVVFGFELLDNFRVLHHCWVEISDWYSMNNNPVHRHVNFESFKCSIPDVVFSLVEAAYGVGFLFGFKLEAESAGQLANADDVGAVRRIDMEAVNGLLTAFCDILGGHC